MRCRDRGWRRWTKRWRRKNETKVVLETFSVLQSFFFFYPYQKCCFPHFYVADSILSVWSELETLFNNIWFKVFAWQTVKLTQCVNALNKFRCVNEVLIIFLVKTAEIIFFVFYKRQLTIDCFNGLQRKKTLDIDVHILKALLFVSTITQPVKIIIIMNKWSQDYTKYFWNSVLVKKSIYPLISRPFSSRISCKVAQTTLKKQKKEENDLDAYKKGSKAPFHWKVYPNCYQR